MKFTTILARRLRVHGITAQWLFEWRMRLGVSQEGAALVLGVRVASYRNWEQARTTVPLPIALLARHIDATGITGFGPAERAWLNPSPPGRKAAS